MTRSAGVVLFAAVAAVFALVAASTGLAKHSPPPAPTIVAKPDSAMVNTKIKLHGSGFAPNAPLTLAECGVTMWSVPADPCADGNRVMVTTNAKGAFHTKMTAALCPQPAPPQLTEETCYIGQLMPSGIDTLALVGSVAVTISWP